MNWFVVPFLRYYYSSGKARLIVGHLIPALRVKESTLILGVWYGAMVVTGIGFFIYLYIEKSLRIGDIEVLVISLSNCFGLLLMFMFLAPGLIDFPRKVWRRKRIEDEQSELEGEVGYLSSLQDEVYYELENQIKILHKIGQTPEGEEYKGFVNTIISTVPSDLIASFPTGLDAYFPQEMYEKDLKVKCSNYRFSAKITLQTKTWQSGICFKNTAGLSSESKSALKSVSSLTPSQSVLEMLQKPTKKLKTKFRSIGCRSITMEY